MPANDNGLTTVSARAKLAIFALDVNYEHNARTTVEHLCMLPMPPSLKPEDEALINDLDP